MELLNTLIWIVNLISAGVVIVLVLMQHGKGADMGAAFGGGSSGSLFGSSGSANFLSRSTAVAAVIFFTCSMALAFLSSPASKELGVMGSGVESVTPTIPNGESSKPAGTVIPD